MNAGFFKYRGKYEKITGIILLLFAAIILAACQANYIRDVQGGTVSPSSTAELTGVETQ
ncbi:TPA: colicin release lysis protein [Escherichia coli]|nr:colicin release lysis protein [Escherichia coli]